MININIAAHQIGPLHFIKQLHYNKRKKWKKFMRIIAFIHLVTKQFESLSDIKLLLQLAI